MWHQSWMLWVKLLYEIRFEKYIIFWDTCCTFEAKSFVELLYSTIKLVQSISSHLPQSLRRSTMDLHGISVCSIRKDVMKRLSYCTAPKDNCTCSVLLWSAQSSAAGHVYSVVAALYWSDDRVEWIVLPTSKSLASALYASFGHYSSL